MRGEALTFATNPMEAFIDMLITMTTASHSAQLCKKLLRARMGLLTPGSMTPGFLDKRLANGVLIAGSFVVRL